MAKGFWGHAKSRYRERGIKATSWWLMKAAILQVVLDRLLGWANDRVDDARVVWGWVRAARRAVVQVFSEPALQFLLVYVGFAVVVLVGLFVFDFIYAAKHPETGFVTVVSGENGNPSEVIASEGVGVIVAPRSVSARMSIPTPPPPIGAVLSWLESHPPAVASSPLSLAEIEARSRLRDLVLTQIREGERILSPTTLEKLAPALAAAMEGVPDGKRSTPAELWTWETYNGIKDFDKALAARFGRPDEDIGMKERIDRLKGLFEDQDDH